jgi:hypothetical protein
LAASTASRSSILLSLCAAQHSAMALERRGIFGAA